MNAPSGESRLHNRAWFPLYLFCVLAATLFPFWIHCAPGDLDLDSPILSDVAQNVLLFWPLGYALRHRPGMQCVAAAILFSLAIELAQFWILRSPSPWDLIANVLGAALGFSTAARLRIARMDDYLTRFACMAAGILLALSLNSAPQRLGNGFEAWEPMPLLIGNELSLDRPWSGSIAEIALYDRASEEPSAWDAYGPPAWREGGPILWMRFQAPLSGRIDGPKGSFSFEVLPPPSSGARVEGEGLRLAGGAWALPEKVGKHVFERLKARGEIGVLARLSPASLDVEGPGRILSLSRDISERGFTLGQSGGDLVFRVRTPVTSDNGTRPDASTNFAPLTLAQHRVWASYDGFRSRIDVDGVCRGERIISSKRGVGTLGETLGVTLAAGCGLAAFSAAGRRRRAKPWLRMAQGFGAALFFAGALFAVGAWDHLPFFGPCAAVLTVVAAALGVHGGLFFARDTPARDTPARLEP